MATERATPGESRLGGEAACHLRLEGDVSIRAAVGADVPALLGLRRALWPDDDITPEGLAAFLARDGVAVFVAEEQGGTLAGFAEVGTRPYAEGCTSSPVGFLEGWYVAPALRRHGVGRLLVARAEAWARERGLTEMGSDTWLDNDVSHAAHRALRYEEVERLVVYRKEL